MQTNLLQITTQYIVVKNKTTKDITMRVVPKKMFINNFQKILKQMLHNFLHSINQIHENN